MIYTDNSGSMKFSSKGLSSRRGKIVVIVVVVAVVVVAASDGNRPKILARALGHNGRASFESARA